MLHQECTTRKSWHQNLIEGHGIQLYPFYKVSRIIAVSPILPSNGWFISPPSYIILKVHPISELNHTNIMHTSPRKTITQSKKHCSITTVSLASYPYFFAFHEGHVETASVVALQARVASSSTRSMDFTSIRWCVTISSITGVIDCFRIVNKRHHIEILCADWSVQWRMYTSKPRAYCKTSDIDSLIAHGDISITM